MAIIRGGRIRQFASPETLNDQPADPTIANFLGEANILAGIASRGLVHTAFGDLTLPNGIRRFTGPAVVLVRPKQLLLRPLADGGRASSGLRGVVVHREYYGHACVVQVDVDGQYQVRVRCPGHAHVNVGDAVVVSASGEAVAWPAESDGAP